MEGFKPSEGQADELDARAAIVLQAIEDASSCIESLAGVGPEEVAGLQRLRARKMQCTARFPTPGSPACVQASCRARPSPAGSAAQLVSYAAVSRTRGVWSHRFTGTRCYWSDEGLGASVPRTRQGAVA